MNHMPQMERSVDGDRWLLCWDIGDQHLELELLDNGLCEWFWKDRTTGEFRGNDDAPVMFSESFWALQKLADAKGGR